MKHLGLEAWVMGVAAALTGACVASETTYLAATKYPAKPKGCPVEVFPSTTPGGKWEDLASIEAHCSNLVGRIACVEELKHEACKVGGDVIYDFKDGLLNNGANVIIATVARRTEPRATDASPPQGGTPPAPAPSAAAPAVGCDPPCSPGYQCSAPQCVAVCNPACAAGQICNQQRVCEAAPVSAAAP